MTSASACLLLALGLTVCAASPARAEDNGAVESLRDGENWFIYGDFDQVVKRLQPLVEPTLRFERRDDAARAFELLGLACFYLRREADARRYFEQLIRREPDRLLDPLTVPPPATRFYEEIRTRLAKELELQRDALKRQLEIEAEQRRQANLVVERIELRRNSRVLAVVPFGVGQFQNDDNLVGTIFLAAELATAASSIAFWLAVEDLRNSTGRFDPNEVERARQLRTAQVATGASALALMVAGATHALATFREESEIRKQRVGPSLSPGPGPTLNLSLPW
jgi:tetratricopeptide (TPR) repeat protein